MKKICTAVFLLIMVLLTAAGCSTENGKVNVINGPGRANSTMLISFNELCSGTVEGFLGKGSRLLVSDEAGTDRTFSEVNTENGTKHNLLSAPSTGTSSVEIAPDGGSFLCNNYLVSVKDATGKKLPDMAARLQDASIKDLSGISYSFTDKSELLLTDPMYYIKKYYHADGSSIESSLKNNLSYIKFTQLRDTQASPDAGGLGNIQIPAITSIKTGRLIPDRLIYIFTAGTSNGNTPLYMFDLYEKKFTLIAGNINGYSLSPGRSIAAYIEAGTDSSMDRLVTVNLETGVKKELLSLQHIKAVKWSTNGSLIAYFGGSGTKIDVGVIKADGTSNEQLTNGMQPSGSPAWSWNGEKLAFTSYNGKKGSASKVYVITLNNRETAWNETTAAAKPEKESASVKLLRALRQETKQVLAESYDAGQEPKLR